MNIIDILYNNWQINENYPYQGSMMIYQQFGILNYKL